MGRVLDVVPYDVSVSKETGVGYIPTPREGSGELSTDWAWVLISSIISKFIDGRFPTNKGSVNCASSVKRCAQATD